MNEFNYLFHASSITATIITVITNTTSAALLTQFLRLSFRFLEIQRCHKF